MRHLACSLVLLLLPVVAEAQLQSFAADPSCVAGQYSTWMNTTTGQYMKCVDGTISSALADLSLTGDVTSSGLTTTIGANKVTAGMVAFNYAGSSSEGGAATTASALAANGGNCSATQYPLGMDAAGAAENCTQAYQTAMVFTTTTAPACTTGGGTTTFIGPSGAGSATETSVARVVVPVAGTIKNLRVWLGGNVPASETAAIKVVLGGVVQANPTCSISAGAAVCNDTTNSLAVVAGDTLNVQVNCSGGTTALNARVAVSFTIQ